MSENTGKTQLNCAPVQALLRSHPLPALSDEQLAHLSACGDCMELYLVSSLAAAPEPEVPADFAASLCAKLPALPPAPVRTRRRISGFSSALIAALAVVCLASVRFAFAPAAWLPHGAVGMLIGSLLVTEVVALALWIEARHLSA